MFSDELLGFRDGMLMTEEGGRGCTYQAKQKRQRKKNRHVRLLVADRLGFIVPLTDPKDPRRMAASLDSRSAVKTSGDGKGSLGAQEHAR